MRYRTISLDDCRSVARARVEGGAAPDVPIEERGPGALFDLDPVREVAEQIAAMRSDATDRDRVEGQAAVALYEALEDLDRVALDDPGFWRFLSIKVADFWEFAVWRERSAFEKQKGYLKYVDATRPTECVLTRMFLRIMALGGGQDEERRYRELAPALPKATDFWRSHVIRVKTATSPAVVRAFARMQRERPLTTKPLREFAKYLTRLRSNVVLGIYDDREADELIDELRRDFDRDRKAPGG